MRKIYLIRHGEPDFPKGERLCIGRTDLPLGRFGRMQACCLGAAMQGKAEGGIYSSHLRRAVQTAEYLGRPTRLEGLEELDAGDWDGLSFKEIKTRWPDIYERRGRDRLLPPPNAESAEAGSKRFQEALTEAIDSSKGDIAVVSHRSVCVEFLAKLSGEEREALIGRLPYASVTTLGYDGTLHMFAIGETPKAALTPALCARLLKAAGAPDSVQEHCAAAAKLAAELAAKLGMRAELAERAGFLHDIARTENEHAEAGAELIERLGYEEEAALIRQHHMLRDPERIDEAAVLFLADKMLIGSKRVSIEERFENSAKKCLTAEAKRMHEQRFAQTRAVRDGINKQLGKEVLL